MKITIIKEKELSEVMQHINLLKIKFGSADIWEVVPLLYAAEGSADIVLANEKVNFKINTGSKVILKFQKFGYEYLVNGEINNIRPGYPAIISIKLSMAQRYNNLRKHTRFDTSLKVIMEKEDGYVVESVARNISRGGAMVVSSADLEIGSAINISITFTSGNSFTASAQILRKSSDWQSGFAYGVRFIEISEDNSRIFNKEILKYEKEYLRSLDILKECDSGEKACFNTRITILCFDMDESHEIKEALVKVGAENFDILHNFRFYTDFFVEEQPKIVVIDADKADMEVLKIIDRIKEGFPQINVILLVPIEYAEDIDKSVSYAGSISILYKPLIYNEFEKEIIKYL